MPYGDAFAVWADYWSDEKAIAAPRTDGYTNCYGATPPNPPCELQPYSGWGPQLGTVRGAVEGTIDGVGTARRPAHMFVLSPEHLLADPDGPAIVETGSASGSAWGQTGQAAPRTDEQLLRTLDGVIASNDDFGGWVQGQLVEAEIAEAIQELNPDEELSDEEARGIADACVATVRAAGISTGKCRERGLPIFVSGNSWTDGGTVKSTVEATRHDIQALTPAGGQAPRSPLLNYERSTQKAATQGTGTRRWYATDPACAAASAANGTDCDEFPFYSTEQGGKYAFITPSLKVIPAGDNQAQGRALQNDLYDKCDMDSGASLPAANATGGDAFLVVPVPEPVGLPTRGLCNGKTPQVR